MQHFQKEPHKEYLYISKQEIQHLVLAALILGFVFGFDDKRPAFIPLLWFTNFLMMSLLSLLSLVIFTFITKLASKKLRVLSEFQLWTFQRFGFREALKSKYKIPIGIILPVIIAFLSRGLLPFSAAFSFNYSTSPARRIGREFKHISEIEASRVAAVAPIIITLLAIILKASPSQILQTLSKINFSIAISTMLPIPSLNGLTVYMGSRTLFVASFFFILIAAIISQILSPALAFLLSILLSLLILLAFYHKRIVQG